MKQLCFRFWFKTVDDTGSFCFNSEFLTFDAAVLKECDSKTMEVCGWFRSWLITDRRDLAVW